MDDQLLLAHWLLYPYPHHFGESRPAASACWATDEPSPSQFLFTLIAAGYLRQVLAPAAAPSAPATTASYAYPLQAYPTYDDNFTAPAVAPPYAPPQPGSGFHVGDKAKAGGPVNEGVDDNDDEADGAQVRLEPANMGHG